MGTIEEKQSYDYISQVITQYKQEAQGIQGSPKFDIWVQQGTSSHRFDIMDKSKSFFSFSGKPFFSDKKIGNSGSQGLYQCHQHYCTFILSN